MKQVIRLNQQEILEAVFESIANKLGLDASSPLLRGDFKFQATTCDDKVTIDYMEIFFYSTDEKSNA